ncbi:MAG: hypothetical protein NTX52_14525 [Planctomycetota bacterium]|nr:hypothetical protein [Planctomycetota bacterium]
MTDRCYKELKRLWQGLGQSPCRAGQISAALWENDIKAGNGHTVTILKATIQRRYKDSN